MAKKKSKDVELIATLEIVRLDGGGMALQLEQEPSQFREKLWRMQYKRVQESYEHYRQLRRKMVRQYKEIERLKAALTSMADGGNVADIE